MNDSAEQLSLFTHRRIIRRFRGISGEEKIGFLASTEKGQLFWTDQEDKGLKFGPDQDDLVGFFMNFVNKTMSSYLFGKETEQAEVIKTLG